MAKFYIPKWKLVIDTREQTPLRFDDIHIPIKREQRHVLIKTVRQGLKTGDYSIQGMEDRISIERKSVPDLVGTVGRGRKRFERELERLNELDFSAVLVEGEWRDVIAYCANITRMNPASLDSSILAWNQRFRGVHWVYRPGRYIAAKTLFKILDRFWKDNNGRKK